MAEAAQRVSLPTTPFSKPELPKEDAHPRASITPPNSLLPDKRQHRELLALAAVGATFGFLTGWGLWTEIHFDSVEFALAVIPIALAAYVLYDPVGDWIKEDRHREESESPERRGIAASVTGSLALIAVAGLDHSFSSALGDALKKLADELKNSETLLAFQTIGNDLQTVAAWVQHIGPFWTAFILLFVVGFSSLLVTYSWARGAHQRPIRSAHWGAFAGLLLGALGCVALVSYLVHRNLFNQWPAWILASLALFWFFLPGLLGGWAIHKLEAGKSPTRDITVYLLISTVIYAGAALASARLLQYFFPEYKESINGLIWLPIFALAFQNLGWALAPYYRRKTCDGPLSPWRGATEQAPEQAPNSGAVLQMSRRDGASSPGPLPIHAGQASSARTSPLPQELIFKPKGDRLWATAAFVLALIVAAPAYLLGTLRNDRAVAGNIEGKLEKDSSLRTKGLAVHSAGRVVTISGVVDSETEHAEAVQRALSVRGVKQLIDQIQVSQTTAAPPITPAAPTQPSTMGWSTAGDPEPGTPAPAINSTVSIGGSSGSKVGSGNTKKPTASPSQAASHKAAASTKPSDAQKHQGIFHFLKKDKNNQPATTNTQAKPTENQNATDSQKKGFFHFLKRDKSNNNDKAKSKDTKSKDKNKNGNSHNQAPQ